MQKDVGVDAVLAERLDDVGLDGRQRVLERPREAKEEERDAGRRRGRRRPRAEDYRAALDDVRVGGGAGAGARAVHQQHDDEPEDGHGGECGGDGDGDEAVADARENARSSAGGLHVASGTAVAGPGAIVAGGVADPLVGSACVPVMHVQSNVVLHAHGLSGEHAAGGLAGRGRCEVGGHAAAVMERLAPACARHRDGYGGSACARTG